MDEVGAAVQAPVVANEITFLPGLQIGSVLQSLNIKTLQSFLDKVNRLIARERVDSIVNAGVIILQRIITLKFRRLIASNKEISHKLKSRLNYFLSERFTVNFSKQIPSGDYTKWFNELFNVSFTDWRHSKLVKTSDQTQCERVMSEDAIQGECYLCGKSLTKNNINSIECEHVLPLIYALSHLWIAYKRFDEYTQGEKDALTLEYAWAHQCCNQVKSSDEFIKFNPQSLAYEVYSENIKAYYIRLKLSYSNNTYDCRQIFERDINIQEEPSQSLIERLNSITEIININIRKLGSIEYYDLFVKYKVLSAFSNKVFLELLSGDGRSIRMFARRDREKEAAARARIEKEQREGLETARLPYELLSIRGKQIADRREALRQRKEKTLFIGGGSMNNGYEANNESNEEHFQFRDLTFTIDFLRYIKVPEDVLVKATVEGIPDIDHYIIKFILENPEYDPTQSEIDEVLNHVTTEDDPMQNGPASVNLIKGLNELNTPSSEEDPRIINNSAKANKGINNNPKSVGGRRTRKKEKAKRKAVTKKGKRIIRKK